MKNLKMLYIALIALVAGTFGACTTSGEFEAGPQAEGPQVSFAANNPRSIEFTGSEGEGTQKLTLTRVESKEELSVFVIAEVEKGAEALFAIPEVVTFAAGETSAELVMNIQSTSLENDKEYTVKLYLDETVTTPYGYSEWQVTFSVNPWELMKDSKGNNVKGKFRGIDLITGLYNFDPSIEVDVDIYEHKSKKGVYRVANPWIPSIIAALGVSTQAEAEAKGVKFTAANFEIDCSDPNCVWFEMQSTGCDFGYGLTYSMSMYWYDQTYQGGADGAVGGTLSEGIITFPVKGTLAMEPGYDDGAYYGNKNGMFRIILPGVEVADYSLAVEYDGMDVAADNKTTTAKFKFSYGDDVTGINYMIVNGNVESDPSDALTTLLGGQDENILEVEDFVKGGKEVGVRVGMERGVYTIVAAPADKNGQLREKDALVKSFYFAGIGEAEEHPCEIGILTEKFSVVYPNYAAQYPDYTAFAYCIYGNDIKAGKYLVASTAAINNVLAQGATMEDIIIANGNDLTALGEVNGENGWVSNAVGLSASTSYTVAVMAENIYGEKAVVTATHVTDAIPYTGELQIGQYLMYCKKVYGEGENDFVESACLLNLEPQVIEGTASNTDYFVAGLGVDTGTNWYATYDSAANTFTISGVEQGYEADGSLFGGLYGYANAEKTAAFGFFSYATEDSKGNDPLVLTVDPSTKALNGMQNFMFALPVFDMATQQQVGSMGYWYGDSTIIMVPSTDDDASTASVKSVKSVRNNTFVMPQFNANRMRILYNKLSGIKSAKLSNGSVKRSTTSVKPIVVEGYTPVKANGFKSVKTDKAFRR